MRRPELGLPFSLEEYSDRIAKTRAKLEERGLAGLVIYWPENIFYLTGFNSLGYFAYETLVLPLEGEPFLVARKLEREAILHTSWLEDFDLFGDTDDPGLATVEAIKRRGLGGKPLGVELDAYFLSVPNYFKLSAGLEVADGSQIVNRIRLIKSPAELEYMRAAARAMEAGTAAGLKSMQVGATENDVAGEFLRASVKAGSEYTGHASLIATGPKATEAFGTWSGQKIQQGDVICFEPGACVQRYHALMMRMVSVGKPDERLVRASEASIAGLNEGMAFIRPGVTSHEVDQATKAAPRRMGLGQNLFSRRAYAVGIGYPPDWGEGRTMSIREGDETVLEANMTFHYSNSIWGEGLNRASFSETIRVTETGCECITNFPRELVVL